MEEPSSTLITLVQHTSSATIVWSRVSVTRMP
nr:MAG TPA: hypothetical protein [Caudoviricetes sp.]